MILRQVVHDDLGCASYVVGDDAAGVAAVVDPRFEIEIYLELPRYTPTTSPVEAWARAGHPIERS